MASSLPVCRYSCQWVTRGSIFPQGLKCKCPRRSQVCAAAPCARAKATSREHATTTPQLFCLLMIVASPCTISVSRCVSEPVTPIFVPPVEMPAPCRVRLEKTTLKPCESFAACRTRLSLPYVLRSTSLLRQDDNGTPDAKVAEPVQNGRMELRAVAVIALQPLHIVDRAR